MNLLTIVVLAYLAGMTAWSARKGLFRSAVSMIFLGVVILVMLVLTPSVTSVFRNSEYVSAYVERQSAAIIASAGYSETALPDLSAVKSPGDVARAVIALAMRTTSAGDQGAEVIASVIINTIAAAATFVIALILGLLIQLVIGKAIKRSGGGRFDHLLGAPIGFFKGIVTVWVGLGFIQLLAYTRPFTVLAEQISNSRVLNWITQHNLLAAILVRLVTKNV